MINCYFHLARTEEKAGNMGAALLLYLSSFCDSYNTSPSEYPYGTIAKIRKLQHMLSLPDSQIFDMVRSYGILTDSECRQLLYDSICGHITGIKAVLAGSAHGC